MTRDFKSFEDLKGYDFIAFVKIKNLAPRDTNAFMRLRKNGEIGIEILELFKGQPSGSAFDQNFKNDCSLTMEIGEQWLLFGNLVNGKITVSRCSYSVIYRDAQGEREWKYFSGIRQLDILRTLFNHEALPDMKPKQFYPGGNIEIEQSFKNARLNGVRKFYHPNGKLYLVENFKNGIRKGYRNFYGSTGQLLESVRYKNGLKKSSITYQDTAEIAWYLNFQMRHKKDVLFGDHKHDSVFFKRVLDSLRQLKNWAQRPEIIFTYYNKGRSYTMSFYGYSGNMEACGYLDWAKQINEHKKFYKNGKIETYTKYDWLHNEQVEYDYKPDGSRREFIRKCESCKFYFDKDNPVGSPEKIYIQ